MNPAVSTLIVYSWADCGYRFRLKGHLRRARVAFDERPTEADDAARRPTTAAVPWCPLSSAPAARS